jgi:3'-phosphoadenosine 5'-phosphosulfate sulfotransferase (PAPS reductase)/FAD synthetase
MTRAKRETLTLPVRFQPRVEDIDYRQYSKILIAFSGGKDSVAAVLTLLQLGVPASQMELHHHLIDGAEGSELMDWPCTESYCETFAQAFNIPIYFSWKRYGFEGEMLRDGDSTAPVLYEEVDKSVNVAGKSVDRPGTRRKYPQVSADLSVRWCSSYIKIMVMQKMLCNAPRFQQGKYLVVTGERAQESTQRSKYAVFEPHGSSSDKVKVKDADERWFTRVT